MSHVFVTYILREISVFKCARGETCPDLSSLSLNVIKEGIFLKLVLLVEPPGCSSGTITKTFEFSCGVCVKSVYWSHETNCFPV